MSLRAVGGLKFSGRWTMVTQSARSFQEQIDETVDLARDGPDCRHRSSFTAHADAGMKHKAKKPKFAVSGPPPKKHQLMHGHKLKH